MAQVTLRILDGADRGRVYENLPTPVTVGREEGNTIQLNDDRVSRFHIKIQEDHDHLVLTDLESTNGTKINGEDVQLRVLRHGDSIMIGRSVLLFGSRQQIALRLARLRGNLSDSSGTVDEEDLESAENLSSLDFELQHGDPDQLQATLHVLEPPEIPSRLGPAQAAQLAELLDFLHIRIRHLLATVRSTDDEERVTLELRQWQDLLDLQMRLAEYLRLISDPDRTTP